MENQGATVVITHHVIDAKQQVYEAWLNEIGPICRRSTGNIDWQVIRPIPNFSFAFTIILRYDTLENLKQWVESTERARLVEKVKPVLMKDDKYLVKSGLDFLFLSEAEPSKIPVRWKQYFVTWSAIYPLSLIVPLGILPLLRSMNIPQSRYIDSLFISGVIVFIMVYLLMPSYTRLIKKWLYE